MQSHVQRKRVPFGVINGNQPTFNKRVQPKRAAKSEHKWLNPTKPFKNTTLCDDVFDCSNPPQSDKENINIEPSNDFKWSQYSENVFSESQTLSEMARSLLPLQTSVLSDIKDSGIQTLSTSMETISSTATCDEDSSCCFHSTKIFSLPSSHPRSENSLKKASDICTQSLQEYLPDILKYLKQAETKYRCKTNYILRQPEVTTTMRAKLVDWLVEVQDEYKLENETLYLAVNYLDRFLSEMSVTRSKLQLLGTTVMFLAAKFEEIYPPDADEFAYVTADTYTKEEVVLMERLILRVLGCTMSVPTTNQFLHLFLQKSSLGKVGEHLSMYLCEISLMYDDFGSYLCTETAAASISLARCILKENNLMKTNDCKSGEGDGPNQLAIISEEIKAFMNSKHDQIHSCANKLLICFNELSVSGDKFLREKYSHKMFHKVALLPAFKPGKISDSGDSELLTSDISRVEILEIWT